MLSRAAFACPQSFAHFRTALIAVTTGKLYGIADHTTPIYEDYARGELSKWEIVLRKTLKKVLHLPKAGFPNDLLHKVTGVPFGNAKPKDSGKTQNAVQRTRRQPKPRRKEAAN